MADRGSLRMAWDMLDARERRNGVLVLGLSVVSALAAAVMVGATMPFLMVLVDPQRVQTHPVLAWAYAYGGFTSTAKFLQALGVVTIATILAASLIQMLRAHVAARYTYMRGHTISMRLMARLLRQSHGYFTTHHSGEMGTLVLSETQQVIGQFFRPLMDFAAALATIVALIGLLLWVNTGLTLVVLGTLGVVYGGAVVLTRRRVRRLGEVRKQANAARFRIANELFQGVTAFRVLGRERKYLDRFAGPSQRMSQTMAQITTIGQVPQFVIQAVTFSGLILAGLIFLGQSDDVGQDIATQLPTIGVLAMASQRMIPELSRLFQSLTTLTYARAAVAAVHKTLTAPTGPDLTRDAVPPLGLRRDIRFDAVSYHHDTADKAGLTHVSFAIAAGERIGVVGATGAGKSTLANILLGLIQPQAGQVLVDGQPITQQNLRGWQRSIGHVPQDIFLIDASIRENIALGLPASEIDQTRIVAAARVAQLDDFVANELAGGYDTLVGERGVRLSGGQRQRIGIARALYEDADFILLDEATSALDNQTEQDVMRAIDALPGDKTILMIAHRLTTLRNCHRILVLDHGQVAGFAPWADLIRDNAIFRTLVASAENATQRQD